MTSQGFSWGEAEQVGGTGTTTAVSATRSGRALSLIFDDLMVALDGRDGSLSKTELVTIRIPVTLDRSAPLTGYVEDLRGFARKTEGARVLILADLGGTGHLIEQPYGAETPESARDFLRTFFSLQRAPPPRKDPCVCPRPAPYEATIMINVQRRTTNESALVMIDSLDICAILNAEPTGGASDLPVV